MFGLDFDFATALVLFGLTGLSLGLQGSGGHPHYTFVTFITFVFGICGRHFNFQGGDDVSISE
ncbi:MAG: hypothetical protein EXS36_06890 [Pedosphaera sp.]|nr:hypothetical protein [Pedosphaera sp.]